MRAGNIFANKRALIFGGATGIGRAAAQEFAARGAQIAIADLNNAEAQTTAAMVSGMAIHADVGDAQSVEQAIIATERDLGPVDILLNNVGIILHGDPQDIPLEEWERMNSINYMGAVRACHYMLPLMLARGQGHIVNTATMAALWPFASSRIPYAASKAALVSYSQNLAVYAEPLGLRVSVLGCGPVLTGVAANMPVFTEAAPMRAPDSAMFLKTAEQAARCLADGMEAGQILITTDDLAFEHVRAFGADPDGFLRHRIALAAAGDHGRPQISDALKAIMARQGLTGRS